MRCPDAIPIGTDRLFGFCLEMKRVANIRQTHFMHDVVDGVVWKCTEKCLNALDDFEGVVSGNQGLYKRTMVDLENHKNVMTYVMTNNFPIVNIRPTFIYAWTIRQGYRDFGLDVSKFDALIERTGITYRPNKKTFKRFMQDQ